MTDTFGAIVTKQGIDFKVWAPAATRVDVVVSAPRALEVRMQPGERGIHSASVEGLSPGARYQFQIDGKCFPDPYSRFQPEGPHAASLIVDPDSYRWQDAAWPGMMLKGQVLYELHVGAFTSTGTFDAAIEHLAWLRSIGITSIEVMPIAEFPGRFNWGYDGVNLFAPFHGYGDYDAFKRFVDAAHRTGLGVILDVVYNHLGPCGNYLREFSPYYFSKHRSNDWGEPFDVDGEQSALVRQFIVDNACYWIREFHLDGLRLDATSDIPDDSERHILTELVAAVREASGARPLIVVAEDERQQATRLLPREQGGFGIDAMWNDDFHHTAQVALRGRRHAYLNDYKGSAQEFISCAKRGFLFQGQYYFWQRQPRGQRVRTPASSLITFLDNHDQVANSLHGWRSHQETSKAKYRALTALLLLAPQTPMLFMGQEFGATSPFLYFADHEGELRSAVISGRKEFLEQFASIATSAALAAIQDPADEQTFRKSKLSWREDAKDSFMVALHRDLLEVRKDDPVIREQDAAAVDGAVLSEHSFLLRWFSEQHGDRLLVINLATEIQLEPGPEPLLGPSLDTYWSLVWSSERVSYGGGGVEIPDTDTGWRLPGESAVLFKERPIASAIHTDA
jgi:maltooligosyltrehalose trehalohydrolase